MSYGITVRFFLILIAICLMGADSAAQGKAKAAAARPPGKPAGLTPAQKERYRGLSSDIALFLKDNEKTHKRTVDAWVKLRDRLEKIRGLRKTFGLKKRPLAERQLPGTGKHRHSAGGVGLGHRRHRRAKP